MMVRSRSAGLASIVVVTAAALGVGCAPAPGASGSGSETGGASSSSSRSGGTSGGESASGSGGGSSSGSGASSASGSGASSASGNGAAGASGSGAAPAGPTFPPPPTWSEVETALRSSSQGSRCFQNNVIRANLADAYADADFNGDGRPERIWQLPDCLLVVVQGAEHWEFPVMIQRRIPSYVDSVRLVPVQREGATLLEVRDTRDEPRSRDTYRFRWTGTELLPAP